MSVFSYNCVKLQGIIYQTDMKQRSVTVYTVSYKVIWDRRKEEKEREKEENTINYTHTHTKQQFTRKELHPLPNLIYSSLNEDKEPGIKKCIM